MGRQLQPWVANHGNRHVKTLKVYVRGSSLLQAFRGLVRERAGLSHPRQHLVGGLRDRGGHRAGAAYFWATHAGAELDLLLMKGGRRYGGEVKFQDAPRVIP